MTRGSGPTEYRHQIPAGSGTAVYTRRTDGTAGTYYATSDHLGSSDLVLDAAANVLARESFTPFGARRGSNWTGTPTVADYTAFGNSTRKGFTGHEMLDSVSLVHMNGRVYDPYLGRFLSADTVIQSLGATESINPYAYAWNDPLKYTDPSGHSLLGDIVGAIVGLVVGYFTFGLGEAFFGTAFWGEVASGALAGFVGGFVGGFVATGSLSAALTAGLIGAVTGGLFRGVGYYADSPGSNWGIGEKVLAHAVVGCVSGELSSGNCGKGAFSAAVSEYLGEQVGHVPDRQSLSNWGLAGETAKYALIGGAASRIVGADFVEGFSVSAAGYLFNDAAAKADSSQGVSDAKQGVSWITRIKQFFGIGGSPVAGAFTGPAAR